MILKTKTKGRDEHLTAQEEQSMFYNTLLLGVACLAVWLLMSVVL
jgi:hypothetical protein